MAQGDIGAVLDTLAVGAASGVCTKLIHIDGLIWAAVYVTALGIGKLATLSISADGLTTTMTGASLDFEDTAALNPDIIHIDGLIYAITYSGVDLDGFIKTVSISADGLTIALVGGSLEYDDNTATKSSIIHIDGSVYAVSYEAYGYDGTIKTVSISADGATVALLTGDLIYDAVKGTGGELIHIAGTIYAIVYQGPDFDGWIKTIDISADGATVGLAGGSLEFDEANGASSHMIKISTGIFAIAYTGADSDGMIKTVSISADGLTLALVGGSLEFDAADGLFPFILNISGTVYAIAYTGTGSDGFILTVLITADGTTITATGSSLEFDAVAAREPIIAAVAGDIMAILYGGNGGACTLVTLGIEGAAGGNQSNMLMMGIG